MRLGKFIVALTPTPGRLFGIVVQRLSLDGSEYAGANRRTRKLGRLYLVLTTFPNTRGWVFDLIVYR